jgi:hypothetical protein
VWTLTAGLEGAGLAGAGLSGAGVAGAASGSAVTLRFATATSGSQSRRGRNTLTTIQLALMSVRSVGP